MLSLTSADAQNRFGEMVDHAQREPVQLTRRGRPIAYVVSAHDMDGLKLESLRREKAAQWFDRYRAEVTALQGPDVKPLSEQEVNALVHELR